MNALAIIPKDDRARFGSLPDALKSDFTNYYCAASEFLSATSKSDVVKKWAGKLKVSASTLHQKILQFHRTGDWMIFVNKAKAGAHWWECETETLSENEEFTSWFCGFAGRNQRKWVPQIRAFHRRWDAWLRGDETKRFPGFDICPADCGKGYPAGMSPRNLYRLLKRRPRAEIEMMRIGTAAAMEFLPPVPMTRVGLRPLEYIFFDDVWLDRKVIVPGYRAPARLLQLGCLDYASGVYLKFGQRPELPTEEGKRERLKERDMKWLVAMLLEEFGFPTGYKMHLICERGTATLRAGDARALFDLSDGQICVCYTGMEGQLVLAWQESSTGNPRGKAPLESWHNLFHNENGALPGQMGKDRDHSPAALAGMEREAMALQTAAHFVSEEQRSRLCFPFSDWRAAYFETQEVVNRINRRTKHDLEGFDNVGLYRLNAPGLVTEWKPKDEAYGKIPGELVKFLEYGARAESPMERLLKLSAGLEFAKIPHDILPRFYEDCHVLNKIQDDFGFTFKFEGKTYSFYPDSPQAALPQGNEYCAYFRPFDLGAIHLTEKTNHGPRYVATWRRKQGTRPGDFAELAKAKAFKQQFVHDTMKNVRRQNAEFIAEQEAREKQTIAALAEADMVPSQLNNPLPTKLEVSSSATADAVQSATEEFDAGRELKKNTLAAEKELIAREGKQAAEGILSRADAEVEPSEISAGENLLGALSAERDQE